MKRSRNVPFRATVIIFLILGLTGCSTMEALNAEEIIQGTWTSEHSVAVYEIALINDEMTVKGYSTHSGKKIQIIETSWDGTLLHFTSYLPSTNTRVIHENRIKDSDTMISQIVGNATGKREKHVVVWKKN